MVETQIKNCKKHGETEHVKDCSGRWRCKKCRSEAVQRKREKLKEDAIKYKGGKCQICGYDKYDGALEFHHIDPSKKDFGIAEKGYTRAWDKVKEELNKCILVCSNCHREIHAGLIDISSNITNKSVVEINKKEKTINTCKNCGKEIDKYATYCVDCASKLKRKVEWPSRDVLKDLIREKSFSMIGKDYGVDGNSVKKWCKSYNLPSLKSEIVKFSDDEWKNI